MGKCIKQRMTETKVAAVKNQNSVWGVQVPWTLGLCVTCRVLSFTTFRPVELRNLITWVQISSLGLFFTSTTLSFPFTAPQTRRNHRTARFEQTSITYTLYIRCIQHTHSWMFAISLSLSRSWDFVEHTKVPSQVWMMSSYKVCCSL